MAAEDSDLEKTEPASAQRLEKAREEGDVPRSRELATATILMAAVGVFWVLGENMMREMQRMLSGGMSFTREDAFDFNLLLSHLAVLAFNVFLAFAPVGGALLLVALASPIVIGGWVFSGQALGPNFGRLNPLSGLGNMVSVRSLVELIKAFGKTILVGFIAWTVISGQLEPMLALALEPAHTGILHLGRVLLVTFAAIAAGLLLIAAIDAPYQLYAYAKKHMMTREEMRKEAKESDGNPEIKAKIRQLQREMARRRMMSEIPNADVIVTNPTHYAVALKYADGGMRAPKVVAMGADAMAAKIREIGIANNVPLLEAPPLARALYHHTELGDEIPEALYTSVAEVLAYVFQLRAYKKSGGDRPVKPSEIVVPPQLDPLNPIAIAAVQARLAK